MEVLEVLLNFNFQFKFVEKGTQRLNTLIKTLLLRRTKDQTCPSTGLHLVRFLDTSLLHLLLCNGSLFLWIQLMIVLLYWKEMALLLSV